VLGGRRLAPRTQFIAQIGGGRVPLASLLGQAFETNPLEFRGDRFVDFARPSRFAGVNLPFQPLGAVFLSSTSRCAAEGALARQKLVEDDSHTPDITTCVHQVRVARKLLGRHVQVGSGDLVFPLVNPPFGNRHGQAEVGYSGPPALVDQNVVGLEVAVIQSLLVDVAHGLDNGSSSSATCSGESFHLPGELAQVPTVDEFLHDIQPPVVFVDAEDADDVGMPQGQALFGFLPKQFPMRTRLGPLVAQHLDRHVVPLGALGLVDHAKTALAQAAHDPVRSNVLGQRLVDGLPILRGSEVLRGGTVRLE
jgi:hypothetical protein